MERTIQGMDQSQKRTSHGKNHPWKEPITEKNQPWKEPPMERTTHWKNQSWKRTSHGRNQICREPIMERNQLWKRPIMKQSQIRKEPIMGRFGCKKYIKTRSDVRNLVCVEHPLRSQTLLSPLLNHQFTLVRESWSKPKLCLCLPRTLRWFKRSVRCRAGPIPACTALEQPNWKRA